MKRLKLIWFTLTVLGGILFCATDTRAVSYALTGLNYDVGAGRIYGTSQTYLDFSLDPYYNAGVDGAVVKYTSASSFVILNSGRQNHGNNAIVLTVANVQRGEIYGVLSDHFVQTVVYASGRPYDPYGISRNYFGSAGGSPYYGFQGSQPAYPQQQWFYLGRTGIIVGLPNITQIAPEAALSGTNPVVQVFGSLLGEHTGRPPAIRVSGSGITARFNNFLPNGVEIVLDIAENAETGNHGITILADPHPPDFPNYEGVPSNTVQFRVGDRTPQITGITPPEGNTGDQVAVTITGTGFGVNPQVQIGGTGVNATINSATPTEIQAVFAVADTTYEGIRDVKIKSNGRLGTGFSPGAGNSDTSNAVGFEVKPLRVTIPAFQVVGKDSTRNVAVQVSPTNNNTPITLTISRNSGSGDAQFSNNQTTIQITRSGNVAIKGITESSVKDNLTLSASLGNATSRSFSVATVKISRTIIGQPNPNDVTNATTPTIVGERINLITSIVPSGINSSSQTWTIPETVVKDFQVSANREQGMKIPIDPLNTPNTSFVWVDGGGSGLESFVSKEVKYDATTDGQSLVGKSTFQVKRPVAALTTETSQTNLLPILNGGQKLIFGDDNTVDGILFKSTASLMIPSTFGGTTQWVQVVNHTNRQVRVNGFPVLQESFVGRLDGCYPYEFRGRGATRDSPFQTLPPTGRRDTGTATVDDNYTMWLMYNPNPTQDGVWVPLKNVNWYWNVRATLSTSTWTTPANPTSPTNPTNPPFGDTTSFPTWINIVPFGDPCPVP